MQSSLSSTWPLQQGRFSMGIQARNRHKIAACVRKYNNINNLSVAEREESKSYHNKGVIIGIPENTPQNTSRKLTLCLFRNGIGICSRVRGRHAGVVEDVFDASIGHSIA